MLPRWQTILEELRSTTDYHAGQIVPKRMQRKELNVVCAPVDDPRHPLMTFLFRGTGSPSGCGLAGADGGVRARGQSL